MVSRKREDPFTPDPKGRGKDPKKLKEYVSPVPKTPLRNVLTPDRTGSGSVIRTASRRPAAEILMPPGSASRSRLASSFESLHDGLDEAELVSRRDDLVQKRKSKKTALLSPVVGSSPRAAPPQSLLDSKGRKTSASGGSIGGGSMPVASVIASEMAARPLPGSSNQKPKMTAEQMNKVFEEWIKIAADNVFRYVWININLFGRKSTRRTPGT